jgi:DNA repair protein RadC
VLGLANNKLDELCKLSVDELKKIKGIGLARAVSVVAALELGRRRQNVATNDRIRVSDHKAAAGLLIPQLQDLEHEVFCVLYLNNAHWLVRQEIISRGGLTATVADIRVILKKALLHNASRMIVAHNHPSGNRQPSGEDKKLTQKLREAASLMDIVLLDHLIVAGRQYTSFVNEGLL